MVETRRNSSSSKHPLSSSPVTSFHPPSSKRSKASESASSPAEGASVSELLKDFGSDSPVTENWSPDLQVVDVVKTDDGSVPNKYADADVENVKKMKLLLVQRKSASKVPWGKLLSQQSQNPHLVMSGTPFTAGQSPQCNLCLKDSNISNILRKLKHIETMALLFQNS